MKKIIVFTDFLNQGNLLLRLSKAKIDLSTVSISITSSLKILKTELEEYKPEILLIDGGLSDESLTNCSNLANSLLLEANLSTKLIMFESNKPMPGVIFLEDLKKLKNYL